MEDNLKTEHLGNDIYLVSYTIKQYFDIENKIIWVDLGDDDYYED